MEEEKGVVVPLMLNCWDWARMLTPVGFTWIKLIWKPLPVGQPLEGPSTVVDPPDEETFSFKVTLRFGVVCYGKRRTGKRENLSQVKVQRRRTMLIKTTVKLEGSVVTVVQETL